ncbi:MAG: VOC family protein [Desulfosudaceae bacterium]
MDLRHIALVCRSEESSDRFYRDLLGLEKQPAKQVPADLMNDIFGLAIEATIINYAGHDLWFEIFIVDLIEKTPVSHHCLAVPDRPALLKKCRSLNIVVREITKPDGSLLVFIADDDHNQFEIKETV